VVPPSLRSQGASNYAATGGAGGAASVPLGFGRALPKHPLFPASDLAHPQRPFWRARYVRHSSRQYARAELAETAESADTIDLGNSSAR